MTVDTGVFEALAEQVAELAEKIEQATTAGMILRGAGLAPAGRHAAPRRLRLVEGGQR